MKSVHADEPMDKFETDPIGENDEMIQPHQIKVELELEQGKITFLTFPQEQFKKAFCYQKLF